MTVIGIHYTTTDEGKHRATLHVSEDFEAFYSNAEKGRGCVGQRVESIYVGEADCSQVKVGSQIEVLYEKAVMTKKGGVFQPVKQIVTIK